MSYSQKRGCQTFPLETTWVDLLKGEGDGEECTVYLKGRTLYHSDLSTKTPLTWDYLTLLHLPTWSTRHNPYTFICTKRESPGYTPNLPVSHMVHTWVTEYPDIKESTWKVHFSLTLAYFWHLLGKFGTYDTFLWFDFGSYTFITTFLLGSRKMVIFRVPIFFADGYIVSPSRMTYLLVICDNDRDFFILGKADFSFPQRAHLHFVILDAMIIKKCSHFTAKRTVLILIQSNC